MKTIPLTINLTEISAWLDNATDAEVIASTEKVVQHLIRGSLEYSRCRARGVGHTPTQTRRIIFDDCKAELQDRNLWKSVANTNGWGTDVDSGDFLA